MSVPTLKKGKAKESFFKAKIGSKAASKAKVSSSSGAATATAKGPLSNEALPDAAALSKARMLKSVRIVLPPLPPFSSFGSVLVLLSPFLPYGQGGFFCVTVFDCVWQTLSNNYPSFILNRSKCRPN